MVKFSVVVIMRNAIKTLPRLAASLKEFLARGGEWVGVDTGSTDDTPRFARELGCTVFEVGNKFIFEIPASMASSINKQFVVDGEQPLVEGGAKLFDYSAARNFAAKMASNDVVSMPDADEQYSALDIDAIEKVINQGYTQLEFHFIFAHDNMGRPAVSFRQCKMYNRRVMHWNGIVHEVLAGEANRTYLPPNVLLLEHFQIPDNTPHRSRYMAGLALDCYRNPENDRNSHYLGRELCWNGRPKSAIKELTRHTEMHRWAQERGESFIFIGDCYMALGNEEEALASWHRAIVADGTRRAPWLRLADHFWKKNDPQKVASYVSAALEIPPNDCYCNQQSHYRDTPHQLMYWALWWLGDKERSKEHWKKAFAYDPSNPKYISDRQFYEPTSYEYQMPNGGKAADGGIQGWMTHGELEWLYHQAQRPEIQTILELGSWKGRSTHALLSGLNGKGLLTAVDTWKGSIDPRDATNAMAKQEDVLSEFKKNVGQFKNLEIFQMESAAAAEKFQAEDRKFDMVFIDAGHTYEEVKRDIELWRDMATVILSGHDYLPQTWMGVCQAVDEMVPNTAKAESIWYKELVPKKSKEASEPGTGVTPLLSVPKTRSQRIPKSIFSIWLSEDPVLPPIVEKCFKSQRAVEGYTHYVVTLADCPKGIPYLDAALAAKKWIKASDYLRIWWLKERGGIYCDSDMEILPGKNFDTLLSSSLFVAREENGFIANSLIGAEKGSSICAQHLEEVVARFKGDDTNIFQAAQEILTPRILATLVSDSNVRVLTSDFFIPYNHQNGVIKVTENTIAFHHFVKSWIKEDYTRDFLPSIAILIPTLGRPEGTKRCLESIDRLYYPKHLVRVVVDADEEATVPQKVNRMAANNPDVGAYIFVGNDVEFHDPWCLYRVIRKAQGNPPDPHPFEAPLPAPFIHGLVTLNSGPLYEDKGNIAEHFLITKKLVDRLGEVFCERMHHVGVDNLLFFKADRMGQALRCEEARVTHHHFSRGEPMDEVYQRGWKQVDEDRRILTEEIEKAKIDFPISL